MRAGPFFAATIRSEDDAQQQRQGRIPQQPPRPDNTRPDRAPAQAARRSEVERQGARRPSPGTQGLAHAVIVRDAVKREGQHKLAGPRRPAERRLGLTHAFAGANDPPQYVRKAWSSGGDRVVKPPPRIELRAARIARRCWSASPRRHRCRIPGHGHAGRQLCALPVGPQPLAGVELAAGQMAPGKQPSRAAIRRYSR